MENSIGKLFYLISCTVNRNVCPFAKRMKRAFSDSESLQTKKSFKIGCSSSIRLLASVLKFVSAFLNCTCSIVVYVLLLFFTSLRALLCVIILYRSKSPKSTKSGEFDR